MEVSEKSQIPLAKDRENGDRAIKTPKISRGIPRDYSPLEIRDLKTAKIQVFAAARLSGVLNVQFHSKRHPNGPPIALQLPLITIIITIIMPRSDGTAYRADDKRFLRFVRDRAYHGVDHFLHSLGPPRFFRGF